MLSDSAVLCTAALTRLHGGQSLLWSRAALVCVNVGFHAWRGSTTTFAKATWGLRSAIGPSARSIGA